MEYVIRSKINRDIHIGQNPRSAIKIVCACFLI